MIYEYHNTGNMIIHSYYINAVYDYINIIIFILYNYIINYNGHFM